METHYSGLTIEDSVPTPQEYCDMRVKAGMSPKALKAAEIGLPNTFYGVSVRNNGSLIGMGRVVGDGACHFEIVDVAVDPQYQGKGIGRMIMEHIDSYLSQNAYHGTYVAMIADEPLFYEKLGYKVLNKSKGMSKKFPPTR